MRKTKFAKGNIYHIFNRGVEKRDIFLNDSDRWRFLQGLYLFNDENVSANTLWEISRNEGMAKFPLVVNSVNHKGKRNQLVKIMADCLMPNHYHLLLEENREGGISRFMHKLGIGYTKYFNKKYDRVGGLFQGAFKAVLVDKDLYLQYLLVYLNVVNPAELIEPKLKERGININDVDKIMKFVVGYPWSTHQEYLGKRNSIIIDKGILGNMFANSSKYAEFAKDVLLTKKFNTINNFLLE